MDAPEEPGTTITSEAAQEPSPGMAFKNWSYIVAQARIGNSSKEVEMVIDTGANMSITDEKFLERSGSTYQVLTTRSPIPLQGLTWVSTYKMPTNDHNPAILICNTTVPSCSRWLVWSFAHVMGSWSNYPDGSVCLLIPHVHSDDRFSYTHMLNFEERAGACLWLGCYYSSR